MLFSRFNINILQKLALEIGIDEVIEKCKRLVFDKGVN